MNDLKGKWEETLKNDLEIPAIVADRIAQTTEKIVGTRGTNDMLKNSRKWVVAACGALVLIASSVGVLAATGFFDKTMSQEGDTVQYEFEVNYDLTAHQLKVTPQYLPEGYEPLDEKHGQKYHLNGDASVGGITLVVMNNADIARLGLGAGNVENVEVTEINGMEAHIVTTKAGLFGQPYNCIFLFNPEVGYVIQVMGSPSLAIGELEKVADNLDVEVLSETVDYPSDAEIEDDEVYYEDFVIRADQIKAARDGEVIEKTSGPELDSTWVDVGYEITDVELKDSIADYPIENFWEYEEFVKPNLNADGTAKQYERATVKVNREDDTEEIIATETVEQKFIVVKMKAVNYSDHTVEIRAENTLTFLFDQGQEVPQLDGSDTYQVNTDIENMTLQMDNTSIYFDKSDDVGGKHFYFADLEAGETLEYTLIYAVDSDKVDNAYMTFFNLDEATYEGDTGMRYVKLFDN